MINLFNNNPEQPLILIVDDIPDNLAVLHDALDETGYAVLVASNGKSALEIARDAQPNLILLDALMPEMDGFQVCQKLKENMTTRHIPVIFMTGLTDAEHVAAGFQAGGIDYVTKPIRPREVLARIAAHMHTAKMMLQARSTLDAFGQAAIAITPHNFKIVWQTPLARQWMNRYFPDTQAVEATPEKIERWLSELAQGKLKFDSPLTIIAGAGRLTLNMADTSSNEQWVLLLREESGETHVDALMHTFGLTKREAEVLYWTIKGKTNKDVGLILESSPRTVNKHLEHVFAKLGVETRTAAASLVASKLRL